jgi:hypothetical protein
MTQSYQIGNLGQYLTLDTTGNNIFLAANSISVGNSTVNGYIASNSTVSYYTGTAYNALSLGGTSATNYVTGFQLTNNLGNYAALSGATFTGSITATSVTTPFVNHGNNSVNVVINSTSIAINGGVGSLNQVLTSNGTATIWQSVSASANAAAQYTWTNTQSFSNTITFSGNVVISNTITVNGSVGSAGQVLTSSATGNAYWSTVTSGGGSFTNGASIAVSNIAYTNTTGTSVGVAYQFINTISGSLDTVFS